MTYDEFKTRFTALISNPDTVQAESVNFLSDVGKDYATLDSMTKKLNDDDKRIRDLQDTNQKLFLSVTGSPAEDEPEKEDNPIDWDALATDDTKE